VGLVLKNYVKGSVCCFCSSRMILFSLLVFLVDGSNVCSVLQIKCRSSSAVLIMALPFFVIVNILRGLLVVMSHSLRMQPFFSKFANSG